jgi:Bacterial Ig-like domain/Putative Ig domain
LIVVDAVLGEFTGGLTHDEENDTGADSEDGVTNNNLPTLSGTAEVGSNVVVEIQDRRYETVATDDGTWTVALEDVLPDGEYTPIISVTDVAGNTETMDGETITIDTVAGMVGDGMGPHQVFLLGHAVDYNPFGNYTPVEGDVVEDYAGGLPTGLSVDETTGHIVGTPEATGMTTMVVNSSDLAGNVATSYFQLVVTAAEKPSTLSSFTINSIDSEKTSTYVGDSDSGQHLNVYSSVGDVLLAGNGDDLFQMFKPESLGFARLDGGAGFDRVNFSGTDLELDLSEWNNPDGSGQVVEHIEALYFAGSNSSLTVTAADIFHLQSDALDVDGVHQVVRFMANATNNGSVTLDGLTQVGAKDAFGVTGDTSTGASNDKYTKFTGVYSDTSGDHLVELLLQHGLSAA